MNTNPEVPQDPTPEWVSVPTFNKRISMFDRKFVDRPTGIQVREIREIWPEFKKHATVETSQNGNERTTETTTQDLDGKSNTTYKIIHPLGDGLRQSIASDESLSFLTSDVEFEQADEASPVRFSVSYNNAGELTAFGVVTGGNSKKTDYEKIADESNKRLNLPISEDVKEIVDILSSNHKLDYVLMSDLATFETDRLPRALQNNDITNAQTSFAMIYFDQITDALGAERGAKLIKYINDASASHAQQILDINDEHHIPENERPPIQALTEEWTKRTIVDMINLYESILDIPTYSEVRYSATADPAVFARSIGPQGLEKEEDIVLKDNVGVDQEHSFEGDTFKISREDDNIILTYQKHGKQPYGTRAANKIDYNAAVETIRTENHAKWQKAIEMIPHTLVA